MSCPGGQVIADRIKVGYDEPGMFFHREGLVQTEIMGIGDNDAGPSRYEFLQGELMVGELYVGGGGDFVQSGGTHRTDTFFLGGDDDGHGNYELSGGELSVDDLSVSGQGYLARDGGMIRIGNRLTINGGKSWDGRIDEAAYRISQGTIEARELVVEEFGTLTLESVGAELSVLGLLRFGPGSAFEAVPDTSIRLRAARMENETTDPTKLAGLNNLRLLVEGGNPDPALIESAGTDLGPVIGGFQDNFTLGTLQLGGESVGRARLVNGFDNQPGIEGNEAIYVHALDVGPGSFLDLNGLNLYYQSGNLDPAAIIVGGTPTLVSEPTGWFLAIMCLLMLLLRRRQLSSAPRGLA